MDIIGRLRSKLDALTAENNLPSGELMEKDINYLNKFWNQLFNLLKDGRYSIDNFIAELFIRPPCRRVEELAVLRQQPYGQCISRIPYTDINMPYEQSVRIGIFKGILP